MPETYVPQIERGGGPGTFFEFRTGEVLVPYEQVGDVRPILGPRCDRLNNESARSKQRKAKHDRRTNPFGVSVYPFTPSNAIHSVEDALRELRRNSIAADYNYVSARTPMRSHAVSYAEPADVDEISPKMPAGQREFRVGVLDSGRPRYGDDYRDYYHERFSIPLDDRLPFDEVDLIFAEPPPEQGDATDVDTMVTTFGQLTHPHAGHGLFVASIVARHAPSACVAADATMSDDSIADLYEILVDLEDARDDRCSLLNMSLGFRTIDDDCPQMLKEAIAALSASDVLLVASAGNDGSDRKMWPAAHHDVVAVAATNDRGAPSIWSNYGSWVSACAVGEDVTSDYPYADWDFPDGTAKRFRGAARWSGTSFAAPLVTALIAERAASRQCSTREAWEAVKSEGARTDDDGQPIPEVYGVRLVAG